MNRLFYDSIGAGPSGAGEIPEAFEKWANGYVQKIAADTPRAFREHMEAEIETALYAAYRHLSPSPGQPPLKAETEDKACPWKPCSDHPLEYKQVLLWFEGLKTMDVGYLINGSWVKNDKKPFWCEPDMWRPMPAERRK